MRNPETAPLRILGVDPGSHRTGFGIIDIEPKKAKLISSGTIVLENSDSLPKRLVQLSHDIGDILDRYRPHEVAMETLFFAQNAQSALKLGHARGVLLMRISEREIPVHEYSPAQIKSAIVGSGRAKKDQIARMISLLLKLPKNHEFFSSDQSDALAIALTHAQSRTLNSWKKNDRASFWQGTF